jgi:hypothetical protein
MTYPTVSPDGKKLAVLDRGKEMRALYNQMCVIDLATQAFTKIGKPGEYVTPYWLSNSQGFVVVKNHYTQSGERKGTICRLGMSGEMTEIHPAQSMRLLGDLPRILFLDSLSGSWSTCNLEGNDEHKVGDGLSGFDFPAVSRTGKQAIMIKNGQQPFVVNLQDGDATEIPVKSGAWRLPVWY